MPLRIQIAPPPAWADAAATHLERVLLAKPSAVIGFPTGRTPLPLYAELRRRAVSPPWNSAAFRAVMLDEYLDAEPQFRSSSWLAKEVFTPLNMDPRRVLRMPCDGADVETACLQFEAALAALGGCDLQMLGLGANGHIGFNEPGAAPGAMMDSRTRVVTLTPSTARANAAYWQGAFTPTRAATMGIATILAAREILLLVRGAEKSAVLRRMLCGPVGAEVPASFLRTAAAPVWVLADIAAAGELPGTLDYNIEWL